ncbi:hypothetical protein NDU88_002720 [Pleurodeles waltl]|uniref:Uncharacterized protein n=1 Tax=Pleurodeles waltl TaxID=8319 RepID=A0AAV7MP60_PLEWA|nr:hypothetical protein NDU88_002720 [Pleurodeles waltl]
MSRTVGLVQDSVGFLQPRTAGLQAGCDSFSALGGVDEEASSSLPERAVEKFKFLVGVRAPYMHQPEVVARSGVACLTLREQAGPSADILQGGNFFEEPSTSQSTVSFVHISGLEVENLDYEERGDVGEGKIVEDVGTIVRNVAGGSQFKGKRSIGVLQKEPSKTVQLSHKGGREEKKRESLQIPLGEKKCVSGEGAALIRCVSVAVGVNNDIAVAEIPWAGEESRCTEDGYSSVTLGPGILRVLQLIQ